MRFCARCGFPLEGAMVLLAHNGMLPHYEPARGEKKISLRRKGVAGSGSGGIPSAEVCRWGFLRGGGPHVPRRRPSFDCPLANELRQAAMTPSVSHTLRR